MRVFSIFVVLFCFVKTSECFPRVTEFEIEEPDVADVKTDDFPFEPDVGEGLEDFSIYPEVGDGLEDFEDNPDCFNEDEEVQQDNDSDLHDTGDNLQDEAVDFDLSEQQGFPRAGLMQKLLHMSQPSSDVLETPRDGQESQAASDDTVDETQQPFEVLEDSQASSDDSVGILQPFDDTDENDMESSEAALPVEDNRKSWHESEETPLDEDDMQASEDSEIIPTPMETSDDIEESDDLEESEESFDY